MGALPVLIIIGGLIALAVFTVRGGKPETKPEPAPEEPAPEKTSLEEPASEILPEDTMPDVQTVSVRGYIIDTNTGARLPAGSAKITIDGTRVIENTNDSEGQFQTPLLTLGKHNWTIEADGYRTSNTSSYIVAWSDKYNYNFNLKPL
jgi:hypothetical protein